MDPYNQFGEKAGRPNDITSLESLADAIDRLVKNVDGAPMAYFDDEKGRRCVYVTVAFRTHGTGALADAKLCQAVYADLSARIAAWRKITPDAPLYWRKRPYLAPRCGETTIRLRCGIPGIRYDSDLPAVPDARYVA